MKKFLPKLAVGLIIFVSGFIFAYLIPFDINGQAQKENTTSLAPAGVNLDILWNIWDKIDRKYVKEIDNKELLYGAAKGIVDSLGDPFSAFLTPQETKDLKADLEGTFSGIGAEIGARDHKILIIAPLPGSPAEKAGVRVGDEILKIDDRVIEGLNIDEVISLIRGPEETKVALTVRRVGEDKDISIEIIREQIHVNNFNLKILGDIGLLKVNRFGDNFSSEFDDIKAKLKSANLKGLVLDMRNNPGGYFEDSTLLAGEFLKTELIVSERGKDGVDKKFFATGSGQLGDMKLVVLVNGGTASAAEIVAGALQENGRAKLIGEKTFGKGSVQEIDPMIDGSSLRLTISKWYTPKGISISEEGISPDVEIKQDGFVLDAADDSQLNSAINLINSQG